MAPRLLAVLAALLLPGCVSYWKGKDMEADIVALQGQVESGVESTNIKLKEMNDRLLASLGALEKKLGDAITQLQQISADSNIENEQLKEQVRTLLGEIEILKRKLVESQAGLTPGPSALPGSGPGGGTATPAIPGAAALPETEPDLYRYCYERHKAADCDETIRACTQYAQKFSGANSADNALYLVADCQMTKKDHPGSVRTLQTVLQKYAKGDKVDDALILMHDNFVALKQCKNALPFLETLLVDYPKSNRAGEARKRQATTKRNCK